MKELTAEKNDWVEISAAFTFSMDRGHYSIKAKGQSVCYFCCDSMGLILFHLYSQVEQRLGLSIFIQ